MNAEPVQTFLMKYEPRFSLKIGVMCLDTINGVVRPIEQAKCPVTNLLHRCDVEVKRGVGLDAVKAEADGSLYVQTEDGRVPMVCQCGFVFKDKESDVWGSESRNWYTNPKTGKEGDMVHNIVTPGAIYEAPWMLEDEEGETRISSLLSDAYVRDWQGKRPPLAVCLPDYSCWIIDQKSTIRGSTEWGPGWTITGEVLNLTASPSIDAGTYHGWLQNGVLTADLENRVYPLRNQA